MNFPEGANVGYRWFESRKLAPLFPFGFGLSYTNFTYANPKVEGGKTLTVSFDVTNVGTLAGSDTPQVYAAPVLDGGTTSIHHLVGWQKLMLAPGEARHVVIRAEPRLLATFDTTKRAWRIAKGSYEAVVGRFAGNRALRGEAKISAWQFRP